MGGDGRALRRGRRAGQPRQAGRLDAVEDLGHPDAHFRGPASLTRLRWAPIIRWTRSPLRVCRDSRGGAMRARQFLLSVTTALTLIALPVVPLGAQPKEVVIGLLYPLSGPAASAGVDEKHAFELFADMVNGKEPMLPGAFYQQLKGLPGFPGGARLRLVFVDHQGKPDIGQAEAERLITQEKAHVLVGAWHSSVTATTSQVAERFGIPHFNAESSSPGFTRRGFKWFFRSSPTTSTSRRRCSISWRTSRRSARHQGGERRHLQRGHALRDRFRQDAAGPRPEGRLPDHGRVRLPCEQHVAHRGGAEAQGGEPGRVVPDLLPVRRHPVHADGEGSSTGTRR